MREVIERAQQFKDVQPAEFEDEVAKALFGIEGIEVGPSRSSDIKSHRKDAHISCGSDGGTPVEVKTGDGPDEYFTLDFPWELNNTDYLRRVLAQVTFALRPIYAKAVTHGSPPLPKAKNGLKEDIEPADADCYYVLKHIREHVVYYSKELGQTQESLIASVNWLNCARNQLAHESLNGVDPKYLSDAFGHAGKLASAACVGFVQDNLVRLQKQVDVHSKSKQYRRKHSAGTSPSATACDSSELGALREKLEKYKTEQDFSNCKLLKLRIDARMQYEQLVTTTRDSIESARLGFNEAMRINDFDRAERLQSTLLPGLEHNLSVLTNHSESSVMRILMKQHNPLEGVEGLLAMGKVDARLLRSYYNMKELRSAGCSASELRAAGCSASELRYAGFSADELKTAGFSLREINNCMIILSPMSH